MNKPKLIRITTIPLSLRVLLKGQLRFMSQEFEVVGVSSAGSDLEEVHQNEGIRVEAIEMTRQITPVQDLISLWKLYRWLKKEKPQIVHTHTPKAGIIGMLAAKLAGVPHRLHTVAGLPLMESTGIKRTILNFVEKLTYRAATKVYPNSKGLYDFILANHYTKAARLKVIGEGSSNGIDTSFFSPEVISEKENLALKQSLGIKQDDFVFVFVGRLVGDKGINELVSAFSQLTTQNPQPTTPNPQLTTHNSKLLLVGPLETALDPLNPETLREIESNPNILSVGFQKDVRPYFAVSDALVFPSYREGFPNVVLQAGAMGLPAIVSDINGCNEIIVEYENGIVIPPKSTVDLQNAMRKLLANNEVYTKLAGNARPMILSRYEQMEVWKEILEEYKAMI